MITSKINYLKQLSLVVNTIEGQFKDHFMLILLNLNLKKPFLLIFYFTLKLLYFLYVCINIIIVIYFFDIYVL